MTYAAADAARRPGRLLWCAAIVLLAATTQPTRAAETSAFDSGLLWRVDMPGVPASYIFGTFHSADPALATPPPALRKVLDQADRVMVEVVSDPENMRTMGLAMLLTDGRRLSDIAGPDRFRRVVETGARYGIPAESLETLKPWGAMGIFSIPPSELRRQAGGETLDRVIESLAGERGIPVLGIETAEEQVAALAGNSEADQLAMLDAVLEQGPRIEDSFDRLRRTYFAGDLAGLYELAMQDTESTPDAVVERYYQRLLWDRNRRMVERILPYLAEGNTLVAIGALHLYGEDGVPGLLAQRGYEVSPIE